MVESLQLDTSLCLVNTNLMVFEEVTDIVSPSTLSLCCVHAMLCD